MISLPFKIISCEHPILSASSFCVFIRDFIFQVSFALSPLPGFCLEK